MISERDVMAATSLAKRAGPPPPLTHPPLAATSLAGDADRALMDELVDRLFDQSRPDQ